MSMTTRNSTRPGVAGGGGKGGEDAGSSVANRANQASSSATPEAETPCAPGEVVKELSKLSALIVETSESHDKKLEEIRTTTNATESKIVEILNRIANVEGRVCFLEEAHERQVANPPASTEEVEVLRQKIDDMENRERRNNLRFLGFTESCEGSDAVAFLEATIPTLFNISFPKGLEIERAHRLGQLFTGRDGEQPSRPRPIIARFARFQDQERIAEAARKLGNAVWKERRIMVFPDYSKLLSDKRRKFNECKKLLHEKHIRFSLRHPAILNVMTSHGPMRFEDHKKALTYIRSMD